MTKRRYYVQCLSGNHDHIMEAVPGSELEARCKARFKAGYLDALCLTYDECPGCVEDRRQRERDAQEYLGDGCESGLNGDECADNCICKNREDIADSIYTDQVQYISMVA